MWEFWVSSNYSVVFVERLVGEALSSVACDSMCFAEGRSIEGQNSVKSGANANCGNTRGVFTKERGVRRLQSSTQVTPGLAGTVVQAGAFRLVNLAKLVCVWGSHNPRRCG